MMTKSTGSVDLVIFKYTITWRWSMSADLNASSKRFSTYYSI